MHSDFSSTTFEVALYALSRSSSVIHSLRNCLAGRPGTLLVTLGEKQIGFEIYRDMPISRHFTEALTQGFMRKHDALLRTHRSAIFTITHDGYIHRVSLRYAIGAARWIFERNPSPVALATGKRDLTEQECQTLVQYNLRG